MQGVTALTVSAQGSFLRGGSTLPLIAAIRVSNFDDRSSSPPSRPQPHPAPTIHIHNGKILTDNSPKMASTEEDQPVDSRDVADILDAEGKEFEKASLAHVSSPLLLFLGYHDSRSRQQQQTNI